ncbi:MAG: TAXI family TRAP transporter solute-binding subunit [Pseudomonadota bacterium]
MLRAPFFASLIAPLMVGAVSIGLMMQAPAARAEGVVPVQLRLATGSPEGVYYEVGSRLQRRVNANLGDHGLLVSTDITSGSQENVRRLLDARVDLAIVQSDVLEEANARVLARPQGLTRPPLTALALLMEEWFVVVVRDGGPIRDAGGLAGRRVALGEAGSGTRFTAERVLGLAGVDVGRLRATASGGMSARADLFCRGRLDAAAFVFSAPNTVLRRLIDRCGARVLSFDAPAVGAAYEIAPLPASAGAGPVSTVKVQAALVQFALDPVLGRKLLEAAFDPIGAAGLNRVQPDGWGFADAAAIAPLPAAPAAEAFFEAMAGDG